MWILLLLVSLLLNFRVAADELYSGQVFGRVFFDLDDSGDWSEGDKAVGGARIVSDRGMEIFTGPDGRYHLPGITAGRELRSGRVFVLDRSTLPAGTIVENSWRRLVQIPPSGLPVRVDFLLRHPAISASKLRAPGIGRSHAGGEIETERSGLVKTLVSGVVPSGCAASMGGSLLPVSEDMEFSVKLGVERGINQHLLLLQCEEGKIQFLMVQLHRIARAKGGDLLIQTRPENLGVCMGPPPGHVPKTSEINLSCSMKKGVRLQVQGLEGKQEPWASGKLSFFSIAVNSGTNRVPVLLSLRDGSRLSGSVAWTVDESYLLGTLYGVASMGLEGTDKLFTGGHLGGYLEWSLPKNFKLILGGGFDSFDNKGQSVSDVLVDALSPSVENSVFQRNKDPEYSWLHSDDSRLADQNPSRSRYLVKLKRRGSFLAWGGFSTDDEASEKLGRWRRALDGGSGIVRPLEDFVDRKKLDLELEGFWAPSLSSSSGFDSLAAHEEFLATGGTLYFLGHGFVREGSERLVVQSRDGRTGMVTSSRKLLRDVDYQVDWTSGRVILTEPMDPGSGLGSRSLISPAGPRLTVLVVEYEYLGAVDGQGAADSLGGAVKIQAEPIRGLTLGARFNALKSANETKSYKLFGSELSVSIGEHSRVWARWADSSGLALTPAYSVDGGISQFSMGDPVRKQGEAYEAGLVLDYSSIRARAMFRRYLEGFSDSSCLALDDVNQGLAILGAQLARGLWLEGSAAGLRMWSGDQLDGVLGVRWRVLPSLELSLLGSYVGAFPGATSEIAGPFEEVFGDGQGLLLRARANWRLSRGFSLFAAHQQNLWSSGTGRSSRDLTMSTLGSQISLWRDFSLGLEAGWGPETGTMIGLGVNSSGDGRRSVFAHTSMSVDSSGLTGAWFTGGQNGVAKNDWVVSSTQTMQDLRSAQALGQRTGILVPLSSRMRLQLAYERSELHQAYDDRLRRDIYLAPFFHHGIILSGPSRRNAVFGRLAWRAKTLALSVAAEYRADEHLPRQDFQQLQTLAAASIHQTVLRLAARWAPVDGFVLAGRVAWAETMESLQDIQKTGTPSGGFLEGSLGAAWRPANIDWLRLIFRASVVKDQRPGQLATSQPEIGQETFFSSSLAAAFYPTSYFQPTLVLAPWYSMFDFTDHRDSIHESGLIGILRFGSEIWAGLGVAMELRTALGERNFDVFPGANDDLRAGLAGEVFYCLQGDDTGAVRFSLGYSLSAIPDPLMTELMSSGKGLFVRLEGML